MSAYSGFLDLWATYIEALDLTARVSICVLSHMVTSRPCGSRECWSQMLFYLQHARSWFWVIPKDICNILHGILLREPPGQAKGRSMLAGVRETDCTQLNHRHNPCQHIDTHLNCLGCCRPRYNPSAQSMIENLPYLPATPDLVHNLTRWVPNNAKHDLINALADFILRNHLPHLAAAIHYQTSGDLRHRLIDRATMARWKRGPTDPHLAFIIAMLN